MMEKLQAPQTHLGLKAMIKEVDEDDDGAISFREFLIIFRKAAAGELDLESGLGQLATLTEVDVDEVGVGGAKTFFEAKVNCILKNKELGIKRFCFRLLRFLKAANLKMKSEKSRKKERGKRRRKSADSSSLERGRLSLVVARNLCVGGVLSLMRENIKTCSLKSLELGSSRLL